MLFFCKFLLINIILYVLDLSLLKALPIILPILLAVAFFTVLERKVLAAMQRRRGPMLSVFMVYYKPLLMLLSY